ncbi:unnamed protein product [Lupinus luteus]|uniref:Uncharacterized protein n=1 Tax=Lupinus luteus TaxID=3873 RepID=A0AAV1X9H6_LUPLU
MGPRGRPANNHASSNENIGNLKILKVPGTDELSAYLNKYHLELDPHFAALIGSCLDTLSHCSVP